MIRLARLAALVRIIPKLGFSNVARVAFYRLRLAAGWRPTPIARPCPPGPFFGDYDRAKSLDPISLLLFGWYDHHIETVPHWHENPFDSSEHMDPSLEWTESLRELAGRDAKIFWELSRFYWAPQFALAARDGDTGALMRLEVWLADWVRHNPPHLGINWTCGQEAAIRLMNLSMAALIFDSWAQPSPALAWLIEAHVHRIRSTLDYALGQDNNHGSAEACALFIAGSWGKNWLLPNFSKISRLGHKWLVNRVFRLIQSDGSPSQYSVTYHRANLETFSLAQLWALRTNAMPLPPAACARIAEGTRWLHRIVDINTGDAPNLGANDGSHLFNVPINPYRDFRPTIALAARLFDGAKAWSSYSDARLSVLGVQNTDVVWHQPKSSAEYTGGNAVFCRNGSTVLLRLPSFIFRPCQSDVLHLELWVNGCNLLRDAGSYSYVSDFGVFFTGVGAHNTVQFDSRDQMPRLSRFLLGDWLKTNRLQPLQDDGQATQFAAGYRDSQGGCHYRHISLQDAGLLVKDEVQGFARQAVLRWRLIPGDWQLEQVPQGVHLTLGVTGAVTLKVSASVPIRRCELVLGWESRHYLEKTAVPVLEVEIQQAGTLTTELKWTV